MSLSKFEEEGENYSDNFRKVEMITAKIVRHSLMTNRKISSRAITMATKKFLGNFL
jgi:hypothetical protein